MPYTVFGGEIEDHVEILIDLSKIWWKFEKKKSAGKQKANLFDRQFKENIKGLAISHNFLPSKRKNAAVSSTAKVYVSTKAYKSGAYEVGSKRIIEHIVPANVLYEKITKKMKKENGNLPEPFVKKLFDKFGYIAIITKAEDAKLKKHKDSMPEGKENDLFARYEEVGIELEKKMMEVKL